jgi:hypothetical protein
MSDRLLFAYSNYYVGNLLWVRVPLHQQRSHAVIVLAQLVVVEMHTMTAYSADVRLAVVCSMTVSQTVVCVHFPFCAATPTSYIRAGAPACHLSLHNIGMCLL